VVVQDSASSSRLFLWRAAVAALSSCAPSILFVNLVVAVMLLLMLLLVTVPTLLGEVLPVLAFI
jgi:hypothetical protein